MRTIFFGRSLIKPTYGRGSPGWKSSTATSSPSRSPKGMGEKKDRIRSRCGFSAKSALPVANHIFRAACAAPARLRISRKSTKGRQTKDAERRQKRENAADHARCTARVSIGAKISASQNDEVRKFCTDRSG